MGHVFHRFLRLRASEGGATSIEYGLIVSLLAVGMITAFDQFGQANSNTFSKVTTEIQEASTSGG
ncbi:MAG: Flp family type IVb pilin [Pseudomonadota bacterium]